MVNRISSNSQDLRIDTSQFDSISNQSNISISSTPDGTENSMGRTGELNIGAGLLARQLQTRSSEQLLGKINGGVTQTSVSVSARITELLPARGTLDNSVYLSSFFDNRVDANLERKFPMEAVTNTWWDTTIDSDLSS
jgi:hypothetical protein